MKTLTGTFLMYLGCFAAVTATSLLVGLVIKLVLYVQGWQVRFAATANAGLALVLTAIVMTGIGVLVGNHLRRRHPVDCGMGVSR